ncbi:uncharacterized protein LOC128033760 [Gossypium raimondii]|uniref:uncharacterized protein LOC128033760 n=1 Tax=Gossypium raimondii TaxID=29730 RepID=UPI00227B9086|nr:uncharacterized protein LOC128033760 [Gossypium raimondii]
MHKEIEVYVDDMIAKSRGEEEHVGNLRKLFERLRKLQLKLNPTKCTFGATSGKLLGFIVSERGIEVDPDKIKAIQELPPPRTQKEVKRFLGRLNYIARFISQLTNQCDPIFRLLRKRNSGEWNEECQMTFEKLKQYLSNPSVLVPPTPGKPLILYLTVFENSMGCILGQHDESGKRKKTIYYLSKKFIEYEAKYPSIEKFYCALVWIRLSEYNIVYVSQKSIKGSTIADFLASRTMEEYESLRFDFPDEDLMFISEEAASFANVTKTAVCRFLKKEIICRYSLLERIISDNALNLNNKMIKEVCEQFQINHHNSLPYRPNMNGAVEAANKNIKRIIGNEKLPFALYAYRTSVRTSTGATHFFLVYGMEVVLPIEVEIPSLRVLMESKLEELEWVRARYDKLNIIEGKCLKAICHR